MKVLPTRKVTYLGVPAEVTEVRTGGPNSRRVVIVHWLEDAVGQPVEHPAGTAVLKHVEGDGRKANFQVHGMVTTTPEVAVEVAERILSEVTR